MTQRVEAGPGLSSSPSWICVLGALGAAGIAGAAQVSIDLDPVPVTLQTAALFLIAVILGGRTAGVAAALYLTCAWLGLPVLSDGGHFGETGLWDGKTAGYVIAFVPVAYVLGVLAQRRRIDRLLLAAIAVAGAHVVVLAVGWLWLARHIGFGAAWTHGVAPFWLGVIVKSLFVALVASAVRRLRRDASIGA